MKITEKEVRYVAALANLHLTDAEVAKFGADLDEILTHIDKLNEIDTDGIEPMAQVLYAAPQTAALRADVPAPFSRQESSVHGPRRCPAIKATIRGHFGFHCGAIWNRPVAGGQRITRERERESRSRRGHAARRYA